MKPVLEKSMDLTEVKRLLVERDNCANDRIDIRNAIQRNLANQVQGLVAEVERLEDENRGLNVSMGASASIMETRLKEAVLKLQGAAKNERAEIVGELEAKLKGLSHPDVRRPVAAVIEGIRKRKS